MIPALNDLRRTVGLPTVPTLTGGRRASRECRKRWRKACAEARMGAWVGAATRRAMQAYADLETGPDDISAPDWREQGRRARMEQAVFDGLAFTGSLLARIAAQVREDK